MNLPRRRLLVAFQDILLSLFVNGGGQLATEILSLSCRSETKVGEKFKRIQSDCRSP